MLNLNRVELLGNVASDAKTRTLQDGSKVCNFRLATNENWKDKTSGERKSKATFHNLTIWNEKTIEFVETHVRTGDFIFVQAKLDYTKAEKEGADTKYFTNLVVKRLDFAQPKDGASVSANRSGGVQDDDIPF